MTETVIIQKPLRSKSMDWFLYDNGLHHQRVKFYLIMQRSITSIIYVFKQFYITYLLRSSLTEKALQLPFQFFFLFFLLLVSFSGRTAKSFLAKVLTLGIKRSCDQDQSHSLDRPRCISLKIVLSWYSRRVWHMTCLMHGTSIHSIQKV